MALTQDVVLSFLLERGGKVKNAELVSAFTTRVHCSEPEERRRNRDLFKSFINHVAVVKRLDDVKYVVVKKKYQEMINAGKSSTPPPPPSSPSSSSPCTTHQSSLSTCESRSITSGADVLNNNSWFCTSPPAYYINNSKDLIPEQQSQIRPTDAVEAPVPTSIQEESLTARVLNVAHNTRTGKPGAVFAVVAIKTKPRSQPEKIKLNHRMPECHQRLEIPPQHELKTVDADLNKSPGIKRRQRQTLVPSSPEPKRGNTVVKPGFGAKYTSAMRLEPQEHDWLVKSAAGSWSQIYSLLLQDVHLAEKRNFISGFTALHWAAKQGNCKILRKILDVGKNVDVNIKSHDGYTPLHVAAIHSHEAVLTVLVRQYGANCNIRDNSGKKAYQYLRKDLSAEVRELLGDPAVEYQVPERTCSDTQHSSLNSFSKLFQASLGHRKKSRHQSSNEYEENRKDHTLDHGQSSCA